MNGSDFTQAMKEQHAKNYDRYGDQGGFLLCVVLMEEVGEIARAVLDDLKDGPNYFTGQDVVRECVDAAAVLMALADEIERPEQEDSDER